MTYPFAYEPTNGTGAIGGSSGGGDAAPLSPLPSSPAAATAAAGAAATPAAPSSTTSTEDLWRDGCFSADTESSGDEGVAAGEVLGLLEVPGVCAYQVSEGCVAYVGRRRGCELLAPQRGVSALHLRVAAVGGRVYLEDLHTKNGTFVAGRPLTPHVPFELTPRAHCTLTLGPPRAAGRRQAHSLLSVVWTAAAAAAPAAADGGALAPPPSSVVDDPHTARGGQTPGAAGAPTVVPVRGRDSLETQIALPALLLEGEGEGEGEGE
eukprot:Rhum_TRINITY_DN19243_c0_g1::Rhum_TRINITY_DN19243_c0_g1_i1::g.169547::m.169547